MSSEIISKMQTNPALFNVGRMKPTGYGNPVYSNTGFAHSQHFKDQVGPTKDFKELVPKPKSPPKKQEPKTDKLYPQYKKPVLSAAKPNFID